MDGWQHLNDTHSRIRWARFQSPFETAKAAADSIGIKEGTYRTYERPVENAGRIPPVVEAKKIARKFKVNWVWMLTGDGRPDSDEAENPRIKEVLQRIDQVPREKQDDALNAVEAVILSFSKRAT